MKINTLNITKLRNDAHFKFHADVASLIAEEGSETLNVTELVVKYQPAVEREDEILNRIVKSAFTEMIYEADRARDRVYASVRAIVKTAAKHHAPAVARAGKRLKIVVDSYGDVGRKSLSEESSAVYNILQEFRGKYAPDAELIRITELVDELERANKEVETLIMLRLGEVSARNRDSMKSARAETDRIYRAITERVEALTITTDSPQEVEERYAPFINRLNTLTESYKLLLHKAKKH